MKKILAFVLLLALGLAFLGCDGDDVAPTKVTVNSDKLEYTVGDKFTLTAKVEPSDVTNSKVTWTSSAKEVATVDNQGKAEALKEGSVKFVATSEADPTKKGEITITIKAKEVAPTKVTSIEVKAAKTALTEGEELALEVSVLPANATNKEYTLSSSDEAVLTVADGKVKAVKAGTAKVIATAKDGSEVKGELEFTVTASQGETKVASIEVKAAKTALTEGEELALEIVVLPANATNKEYTLSSSDEAVLTVADGKVKAVKAGTAKVIATAKDGSEVKGELEFTVTASQGETKVTSIQVKASKTALVVGDSLVLTVVVLPVEATNKEYTLSSSDETVLTVANGKVTAVKAGTAKVIATANDGSEVKGELEFTVTEEQAAPSYFLVITGNKTKAPLGTSLTLEHIFYPEAPDDDSVVWAVDDSSIATIDENGVLTPVAVGKVKVSVTSNADTQVAQSTTIEIVAADDTTADGAPTSLTITCNKTYFLLHDTLSSALTKTWLPADVTYNKSVYWESDDTSVVAVNGAYYNPVIVGVGSCTVTCFSQLDPTIYATVDITVEEYVDPETLIITNGITEAEQTKFDIYKDKTQTLHVSVTPEKGNPAATFVSSDETIAKVDENGKVTALADGTCTITCTSSINPELVKVVTINVTTYKEVYDVERVEVKGEKTMYVGYKLKLSASVYPETAPQTIKWELYKTEIATLAEDGTITALAEGSIRVRAISVADPTKKSTYFNVKIISVPTPPEVGDLKGYKIIIMNADSALSDNDPFLEKYAQPDKIYKQKAWDEVEKKYNCDIEVVKYPDTAPWGTARINWIIDNATAGTSQCDLGIVSSNWIYRFAQANAGVDVSEYYNKYGLSQMDDATKSAGSYNNKLYIASTGLSPTATYVGLGLYYNYGWVKKLGVDDPAKLFNDGKWNYTGFKEWVTTTQAKLGENQFVLQGHPYYYWFGMTNAAGQKVADSDTVKVFIDTQKSKDASALIYELVQAGAVNTAAATWAESDDIDHSFHDGETLMTTGDLWFCRTSNRWKTDQWGVGTTEYGYVPFPYPDSIAKEDTKVSLSGLSVYMYIAGRQYPAEMGKDGWQKVWCVMNEMFLNTITYQEADKMFNAEDNIRNTLSKRLDNEESIKAIMFYNSNRIFYDPAHAVYGSISETPLKAPAVNAMYKGESYEEQFNAVYEQFYNDIIKVYAVSE